MADTVICPVCGETNPADMEFCRHCQSRLRPLTGSLKNENAPIQPGQLPTKKVTSELEPVLPQWLREARQRARQSEAEAASKPKSEDKDAPAAEGADLLAGLASQAKDEDEETPDWLAHFTGAPAKKKKPVSEDNQVKWVELGHAKEAQDSSLEEGNQPEKTPRADAAGKDELAEWFKQASSSSSDSSGFGPQSRPPESNQGLTASEDNQSKFEPPSNEEDLGWLKNLEAAAPTPPIPSGEAMPPAREETADWLKNLRAEASEDIQSYDEATPPAREEAPDWLKKLQAENPPPEAPPSPPQQVSQSESDVPAWLKSFGEAAPEPLAPEPPPQEPSLPDQPLPDWLRGIGSTGEPSVPVESGPVADESSAEVGLPDWISSLGAPEQSTPIEKQPEAPAESGPVLNESSADVELPDWISSLGKHQQSAPEESQPAASAPIEPVPDESSAETELPDWISSLGKPQQSAQEESQPTAPAFELSEPPLEPAAAESSSAGTVFTEDTLAGNDVDAIFASMQTPDWLSAVLPNVPQTEENVPAAAQEEEPIGPAELPSWVQAMRPVESAMATSAVGGQDTSPEEHGPLAGLHGVLPAIPGAAAPSSKPKAHSIKLDATEQQQAHAVLLEKILAAETSPIPMRSGSLLRSQRMLRWILSIVLLIVLGSAIFTKTQSFPLPGGVPNETIGAIKAVEAVPVDAPVLLVFDYQPATIGEMEATGASLLDHLLLLKHPHLVLLSTSPTGSALAERFLSTTLADRTRDYVRGVQYVDLGYLPGGLAGVYDFAQNPRATMPLGSDSKPVWQSAALVPVIHFSDFAAVIVLTDSVESGRVWIEQTALARGDNLMVIAASAQAGPMLLPYVDSGQVNGLISGMNGASGAEQANGGLPGFVRRYWDAYSIGLYLAVLLIIIGGLWNLWLGIQDRRAQAVG